jgi:polar amino acid transport system substrate-binding protein
MFFTVSVRRLALPVMLMLCGVAPAADLRISLPILPPMVDEKGKGPLGELARAIAREWKEGRATIIGPVPFEQSVENVVAGRADLHFPLISSPARLEADLPFRYSTVALYEVPFALYSHRGNGRIDRASLTLANLSRLRIETDRAHARLFYFPLNEAADIESGLHRVEAGDIDGFLFSANATDPVLKRLKLPSVVKTPYRRFNSMMVLPKGPAGDALDEKLGLIIDRLKDSGEYQRIMAPALAGKSGK